MVAAAVIQMTRQRAEELDTGIKRHLDAVNGHLRAMRRELDELNEFEGYRLLGYASFKAYCLKELHHKHGQIYRELAAAKIERVLQVEIGTISENALRPIMVFEEDVQQTLTAVAIQAAGGAENVTEGVMKETINMLSDAVITGCIQDEQGEQHPLADAVNLDLQARLLELRQRNAAHKSKTLRDYVVQDAEAEVRGVGESTFTLWAIPIPSDLAGRLKPGMKLRAAFWVA